MTALQRDAIDLVQRMPEDKLSEKILEGAVKAGESIKVSFHHDEMKIDKA